MNDRKKELFEKVYGQYVKHIFRYVSLRLAPPELAEDITTQVFLKLWNKIVADVEIENIKALIFTIAHGLIIDEYRKKKERFVSIDGIDDRLFGQNESLDEEILKKEDAEDLNKKLNNLKPEYKNILILYYIQELKTNEIAEIINKKESTVRVNIHRALQALKKLYE